MKSQKHPPKISGNKTDAQIELVFLRSITIDDGCWTWNGAKVGDGYGAFFGISAHRYSYEYFNGPIPPGLFVLHSCDNRRCVNPHHLHVGTQKENMLEARARKRWDASYARYRIHPRSTIAPSTGTTAASLQAVGDSLQLVRARVVRAQHPAQQ